VIGAETAYARKLGVRVKQLAVDDIAAIEGLREAIAAVVGALSDGSPVVTKAGPRATRPAGSPGTFSNMPGRCRTDLRVKWPHRGGPPRLRRRTRCTTQRAG
jgi:hypothetical protein